MNFRCARLKICFYSKTDFELSLPNHILQVNKIFYGSVTWCPHQGLLFHLLFQENRLCPNPMDVESLSSLPHILRSWSSMKVAPSELTLAHLFLLYTVKAWEHQSPTVQWTLDPSENQTVSTVDPEPRAAKLRWKWNEAIPLKMTLVYSIFYDDPVMFKTCNNSCILVIWGGIFWLRCFRRHKSLVSVQTGSHF